MSETEEVSKVLIYFQTQLKDISFVWRNNTGAAKTAYGGFVRFGYKGSADIIGCFLGRFIAIEMKFGKGVQREHQEYFQRHVEETGGIYILAYSLEEVIEKLKNYTDLSEYI